MAEVMKSSASGCPDPETMAAYLDGRLPSDARARITEHLAACQDCYFVFKESAQMHVAAAASVQAAEPRGWGVRVRTSRVMWSVAGTGLAAAAAITLFVGTGGLDRWRSSDANLQALVAAVGEERMFEPRLAGGFAFGPLRGPVRAGESAPALVSPDVRIAAAQIEKAAVAHRTPRVLTSLGVAHLVLGDLDRAVAVLEEAADQPLPSAATLNDLAAAYLVRATRSHQPQDLPKALSTADRAVKADPRLAEAWFNRAFALERLSLTSEARQAWQDYLKIDDRSAWAGEARARLRALGAEPPSRADEDRGDDFDAPARRGDISEVRRLVRQSPESARQWVQTQLLNTWAAAAGVRDQVATAAVLAATAMVGHEYEAVTGDPFSSDAVAATTASGGRATDAADLARAHALFLQASTDYDEDRIRESMPQFQLALVSLDRARSPLATSTRLYLAIGQYYAGDLAGAKRALDPVIAVAGEKRYGRLLGLAHRMRGLIDVVSGDLASGLEEYRSASLLFDRVGDVGNDASMHALIGEDLNLLGEPELAWSDFSKALAELPRVREPRHRHVILQQPALAALHQGMPEAALHFQHATLDNARRWGRPLAVLNAQMYSSEMQRQIGDTDLAMTELDEARRTLAQISDAQLVARDEAQIQLAEGEVEWRAHPAAAVDSLSKALVSFARSRTNWPLVRLHLARGRAQLAEGREDLAEADFSAGIEIFERQRAAVTNEALRSASFERPWDLFTEMIRFQAVNRRRPDLALAFAERARARTLLESLTAAGQTAAPVDPALAHASLPPAVTMVYYATLDDRLLIWTLTRTHVGFVDSPVRSAELVHLLEQYQSEMAGNPGIARDMPSLTRLYDVLIRPIARALPEGSEIVVVPDGVLHAVPFAALIRKEQRRYLVEDRAVQVTPSLTVFLTASARPHGPQAWRDAFIVGNPRAAGGDADAPPDLPEAEAEARDVASLYRTSALSLGPQATKDDFLANAGRFSVVHFAGHAIANDGRPELSRLLVAGADESARSLFARDIAALHFDATQLVVLGACRTNVGRIRRGEGVFNLARPFLAAGVPMVVASLWNVDDRASHRLLVAFHRALRGSGNVAEALRHAQLELMGDADPLLQTPAAWAGFTVIGGRVSAGSGS
jgi:CHAT domain-containing protein/tetratricopeptide (TPR) repeat protein